MEEYDYKAGYERLSRALQRIASHEAIVNPFAVDICSPAGAELLALQEYAGLIVAGELPDVAWRDVGDRYARLRVREQARRLGVAVPQWAAL